MCLIQCDISDFPVDYVQAFILSPFCSYRGNLTFICLGVMQGFADHQLYVEALYCRQVAVSKICGTVSFNCVYVVYLSPFPRKDRGCKELLCRKV